MQTLHYIPQGGVCSREIQISVEDGIITEVRFTGGCDGNAKGVSLLVKGMKVEEVIARLDGVCCKSKTTSCPDQLAQALKQFLETK